MRERESENIFLLQSGVAWTNAHLRIKKHDT